MTNGQPAASTQQRADQIHDELTRRYAAVARKPAGQFPYPTGRASAERLGYRRDLLDLVPDAVVERFVGVGNPFSLGEPHAGWNVVDIGCGAGFDSQFAARFVGPQGRVVGVDLSEEMLAEARQGAAVAGLDNVEFRRGLAEALPVEPGWADLVISNGVLNLAACKPSAFREVARVLRPGGHFRAVDLVLVGELPPELADDEFAWSN